MTGRWLGTAALLVALGATTAARAQAPEIRTDVPTTLTDENELVGTPARGTAHCGGDSITRPFGSLRELGAPGHRARLELLGALVPDAPALDLALRFDAVAADLSSAFVPRTCVVLGATVHVLGNAYPFTTLGARAGFVTRTDGGLSSLRLDLEGVAPALPSDASPNAADASRRTAALSSGIDDVYSLSALSFALGGRARALGNIATTDGFSLFFDLELAGRVGRVRTDYGDREGLAGGAALGVTACGRLVGDAAQLCVFGRASLLISTFYTADVRLPFQIVGGPTLLFPHVTANTALLVGADAGAAWLAALPAPFGSELVLHLRVALAWSDG